MSKKDPFEIGKVEGVGSAGAAGGITPSYGLQGPAAANRATDGATPAPGATGAPAAPASDKVQLTPDADDDNTVKDQNFSSLISALAAPQGVQSTQKVNEAQGAAEVQGVNNNKPSGSANYQPGMQGGAVYGPNGIQGVEPGMAAGPVYGTRPPS